MIDAAGNAGEHAPVQRVRTAALWLWRARGERALAVRCNAQEN
jgi:hypothetical protein